MANPLHLRRLKTGISIWNQWQIQQRQNQSDLHPWLVDLTCANLSFANLAGADLSRVDLSRANLYGADLRDANLSGANLTDADLSGAILQGTTFCRTIMPNGRANDRDCQATLNLSDHGTHDRTNQPQDPAPTSPSLYRR
jgi:hypothetical protein